MIFNGINQSQNAPFYLIREEQKIIDLKKMIL